MADSALRLFMSSLLASSASPPAPSAPPAPPASGQISSDFNAQLTPASTPLFRRTSWGSTSSTSSTDSEDPVELRDWTYGSGEEQDEVKRKRRENRKRREREAEKAWREFWG